MSGPTATQGPPPPVVPLVQTVRWPTCPHCQDTLWTRIQELDIL